MIFVVNAVLSFYLLIHVALILLAIAGVGCVIAGIILIATKNEIRKKLILGIVLLCCGAGMIIVSWFTGWYVVSFPGILF